MERQTILNYLNLASKIQNVTRKISDRFGELIKYKKYHIHMGKEYLEVYYLDKDWETHMTLMIEYDRLVNINYAVKLLIDDTEFDDVRSTNWCGEISEEVDMTYNELKDYFKLKFLIEQEAKELGRKYTEVKNIEYKQMYIFIDFYNKYRICIKFINDSITDKFVGINYEYVTVPIFSLLDLDKTFELLLMNKFVREEDIQNDGN